ncbi:hypothetical protein B0H11DRAFT_1993933 [Mycena galericulata]|nr:hypothetical protein B0H11DRAFT_1993933 [Mycena galericulata]
MAPTAKEAPRPSSRVDALDDAVGTLQTVSASLRAEVKSLEQQLDDARQTIKQLHDALDEKKYSLQKANDTLLVEGKRIAAREKELDEREEQVRLEAEANHERVINVLRNCIELHESAAPKRSTSISAGLTNSPSGSSSTAAPAGAVNELERRRVHQESGGDRNSRPRAFLPLGAAPPRLGDDPEMKHNHERDAGNRHGGVHSFPMDLSKGKEVAGRMHKRSRHEAPSGDAHPGQQPSERIFAVEPASKRVRLEDAPRPDVASHDRQEPPNPVPDLKIIFYGGPDVQQARMIMRGSNSHWQPPPIGAAPLNAEDLFGASPPPEPPRGSAEQESAASTERRRSSRLKPDLSRPSICPECGGSEFTVEHMKTHKLTVDVLYVAEDKGELTELVFFRYTDLTIRCQPTCGKRFYSEELMRKHILDEFDLHKGVWDWANKEHDRLMSAT